MLECATCGGDVFGGDAHHFDAADRSVVWHMDCAAPEPKPSPRRKSKPITEE